MEELSYVLTQYFVSCVHVRFYFSLPLIFTLLLAGCFSHCLTAALNFHVFLLRKFVSFVFNHSFYLFLCYPHEWKRQKWHWKRHNFVVVFSFLKSGRPCNCYPNKTLSCISVAIPFDWIILHWYACGADRLSGGQSVSVRSGDYQIFSDG